MPTRYVFRRICNSGYFSNNIQNIALTSLMLRV